MDNLEIEIRFADDPSRESPGRLTGTLMTYGEVAKDRAERFMRDSLLWDDTGIVINEQHNREAPIVRAIPFLEGNEVRIDTPLPNTQRGRDAATNVREGLLTGLSVEFSKQGVVASFVGGIREIRSARLVAAGLVDSGSYTGSTVSVRQYDGAERWRVWL